MIVHLPFVVVPELHVRREGFLDRVAGALGFEDIDFESEEFSRRFHVKSGSPSTTASSGCANTSGKAGRTSTSS